MIDKEILKKELESAISKAEQTRRYFYELGKAGDRMVKQLDKDLAEAADILRRIDKVHALVVRNVIKKLA